MNNNSSRLISAMELANYSVCPEAWRLKYLVGVPRRADLDRPPGQATTAERKQDWVEQQDLSSTMHRYSRIVYVLLFVIAILVFALEVFRKHEVVPGTQAAQKLLLPFSVPLEVGLLTMLLGLVIFFWDYFDRRYRALRKASGLAANSEIISAKGSRLAPENSTEISSLKLGLIAKPDAIVEENGSKIPVHLYPNNKSIKDRHVLPTICSLMILEEQQGKTSPYGILIMGKDKRRVEVKYSADKQVWLKALVEEMRSIAEGVPAMAKASKANCASCDVRANCQFAV